MWDVFFLGGGTFEHMFEYVLDVCEVFKESLHCEAFWVSDGFLMILLMGLGPRFVFLPQYNIPTRDLV